MFNLNIVTPLNKHITLSVEFISVPSTDGTLTVLQNHMDLIVPIDIGVITYKDENGESHAAVSAGLFTFKENEAVLFVDTVEHESNIDFMRAEAARQRAVERIAKKESLQELQRGELALKRSLARLSLDRDKKI